MRVLVFATDVTPIPGLPTSGTALRTHGIIQGLKAHGFEVTTAVPSHALAGLLKNCDRSKLSVAAESELRSLRENSFHGSNQGEILSRVKPDVVIGGHWACFQLPLKPSQRLVLDLPGPYLLERHFMGLKDHDPSVRGKLSALASADNFIVSGPSQRFYFLSFLRRLGLTGLEDRIVNITMPLDPTPPEPRPNRLSGAVSTLDHYPRFIFAGLFLPWQNPRAALEIATNQILERQRGSLSIVGGEHPHYGVNSDRHQRLMADLRAKAAGNPMVKFHPLLPFDQFVAELGNCDVALDLMEHNLERQLAVTIRSTTYLWAGLPVIYNDYADLSKLIQRYDAGWCISPGDQQALLEVIEEIYNDPEKVARKSSNAARLARREFSWDRAVEPLVKLLRSSSAVRDYDSDILLDFPERRDVSLESSRSLSQHFVCRQNGLARVECQLADLPVASSDPLTFKLFVDRSTTDSSSSASVEPTKGARQLIAQRSVEISSLSTNRWIGIDFPALEASAGKHFRFEISLAKSPHADFATSTNSSATTLRGVVPWLTEMKRYPVLDLVHGDSQLNRLGLCLRTQYKT